VTLPRFSELSRPESISARFERNLARTDPDAPVSENLWRLNWYNAEDRVARACVPGHVVLPAELTGIEAPIVVLLGSRFPLVGAHKVLAAYACLVARLVTGRFDPSHDRAIWPSTGNYCRGGVAISRILGCRAIAVLPAGMSRERFEWLERWVADPADIIRTPGSESNVKEIYDKCAELERDPRNVVLNQFADFSNYLIHYHCTGRALDAVFSHLKTSTPTLRLAAFVAATGSSGTLAAGDYLKSRRASRIAAAEALECPTMLLNGYGEHNIQGIGDKHVPLIHNVMNTDLVVAVTGLATDSLNLLFGCDPGKEYLVRRRKLDPALVRKFEQIGISGLANILAAIKVAKHLDYGRDDVVMTVATDGSELYASERRTLLSRCYPEGFDEVSAAEIYGAYLRGIADDHVLELDHLDRKRIFNLGYYTWVEQRNVAVADFEQRRDQGFWQTLCAGISQWDGLIAAFNEEAGIAEQSEIAAGAGR
jgi:cysteine synthase